MTDAKVRFEFLLNPDIAARVNALAAGSHATKTDIIVKAIEAFLDRGRGHDPAVQSAVRLDKISRELEDILSALAALREDFGKGKTELHNDVKTILMSLGLFVRWSLALSAHLPMPEGETKTVFQGRYEHFVSQLKRRLADEKPSPSSAETKGKTP